MALMCPSCGSENVQSFQVIYETGTHSSSGLVAGAIHGAGPAMGAVLGRKQSIAAAEAAPPSKRIPFREKMMIIGGGLAATVGIIAIAISHVSYSGLNLKNVLASLLLVSCGIGIAWLGLAKEAKVSDWNKSVWPKLHEKWLRSFRCLKCGRSFHL